jgi:hypothetical protein
MGYYQAVGQHKGADLKGRESGEVLIKSKKWPVTIK